MVRFARAKGSKASNEKLPEKATPWHVMKNKLEEKQQIKQEIEESKNAIKTEENNEPFYPPVLNTNAEWAEFENAPVKKEKNKFKSKQGKEFRKKNNDHDGERKRKLAQNDSVQDGESRAPKPHPGVLSVSSKRRLRRERLAWKKTGEVNPETSGEVKQEESDETKNKIPEEPVEKKLKLEENVAEKLEEKVAEESEEKVEETPKNIVNPLTQKLSASAKRRLKKKQKLEEKKQSGELDESKEEKTSAFLTKRQKRNLKRKTENAAAESSEPEPKTEVNNSEEAKDATEQESGFRNGPPKKIPRHTHLTPAKIRDDKEHARRKPDHGSMKIFLHGEEVEVVRFEGYPMRKEDAIRLKELRQQMIMKGVPKAEVEQAMKMERRKAEKNLSRIKKQVCFLCRKSGHNLSDCPNLDKEQSATGICFKCGSTEHTHFECKVNKADTYKFASCFICKERGHIAKQCPDNPKGMYPDGGCCNFCGDVTHLKKDCPELIQKKEEATITVETISNDLESLGESEEAIKQKNKEEKSKPKVVKF